MDNPTVSQVALAAERKLNFDRAVSMILLCIGGPMHGAQYVLSKDVSQRSTNRKPDALVFDRLAGEPEAMYRQGSAVVPYDERH